MCSNDKLLNCAIANASQEINPLSKITNKQTNKQINHLTWILSVFACISLHKLAAVDGPVTVGDPLTLLIHMKSEKG